MVSVKFPRQPTSSVPGLDYLTQLSAAYSSLLENQAAEVELVWQSMSSGGDVTKAIGLAFSRWTRNVYDLLVDASKGPAHTPQPEWVYFSFTQVKKVDLGEAPRLRTEAPIDRAQPPDTFLETTHFISRRGDTLPGTPSARTDNLYKTCRLGPDGRTIIIELNVPGVNAGSPGLYLSFVAAKYHGGHPPLAIVVLKIDPPDGEEPPATLRSRAKRAGKKPASSKPAPPKQRKPKLSRVRSR